MSGAPQSTADCPTLEPLGGKAWGQNPGAPRPSELGLDHVVPCERSQLSTFWASSSDGNFPAGGGRLFWKVPGGAAPARPPGSHAALSLGASGAQGCTGLAPPQLASLGPAHPLPSEQHLPPAWPCQSFLLQVGKPLPPRVSPVGGQECLVVTTAQEDRGGSSLGWKGSFGVKTLSRPLPWFPLQYLGPRYSPIDPASLPSATSRFVAGAWRSLAALRSSFVKEG